MRITGMRPQEAKAIRKDDIEFTNLEVTDINNNLCSIPVVIIDVKRSIGSTRTQENVEVGTKTKYSKRAIPIKPEDVSLIKEMIDHSRNDLIFSKYSGEPYSFDELSNFIYRVRKKLILNQIYMHT